MVNRQDRLRPGAKWATAWLILFPLTLAMTFSPGCGARPKTRPAADDSTSGDLKATLRSAIEKRDWPAAMTIAQQAMLAHPEDPDVLTNVAIATAQTGDRVRAAQLLVEAARVSNVDLDRVRNDNAIAALLDVGHLYEAIDFVSELVRAHPDQTSYRRMLVGFLGEAQLVEDVDAHMAVLIEQRQFDLPLLLATTETSSRRYSKNTIELLLQRNPSDLRPRLGEAKQHLDNRDAGSAEKVLREIIAGHPDFAPAHAMLGIALVSQGKRESYPSWYEALPEETSGYSGYWFTAGDWALSDGDAEAAVRALAKATRLAPNESSYWTLMAVALRQWRVDDPTSEELDVPLITESVIKRQKDLLVLRDRFLSFKSTGQRSQSRAVEVAEALMELGRLWEAEAWLAIATTLPEDPNDELASLREEVLQGLAIDHDWQSQRGHPELAFDLSRLRFPDDLLVGHNRHSSKVRRSPLNDEKLIRMRDASAELGLSYYGRVGEKVRGPRIPITQTLGCGGAMIDFDADGREDLVFAAAGGRIRKQESDPGAVFRNVGSFVDVSSPSGFLDMGYSHGISVGDYNDDGLADLLVLNLGPNRLFRNNGDGTFADVSELLGDQGEGQWSTSGAIVDVNQDGHNDIVIVNYCDSHEPLERPCFDAEGNEINCYPLEYRAARDQVLSGLGDGTFVDQTDSWIGEATLGRGLGIIAGRLDGMQQCVYIVNDASPNTFYRWQASESKLVDQAISSGLAVDAQSLDQGSMGIASSDFDHDGDLDLYVTGFASEYNILYEQQSPGFWFDRTAAAGMVGDTLQTVGFGTEAIDLDNDGNDEILVTNGHVGDFNPPLPPYAQPMQLFHRMPDGRYGSIDLKTWGGYFASPHVGRALFTGDLNGDGYCDAVVTHATEPVAVLLNDSKRLNHVVGVQLVDRNRCRDAIGAMVEFEFDNESGTAKRVKYKTAGHGYLCSNQQLLWTGTGSASRVRILRITWPNGSEQTLRNLEADAMYLIVRDESPYLLRRFADATEPKQTRVTRDSK